jgi:8-oxo-dGTP pyrophosphatase MutT (NUDIX family)
MSDLLNKITTDEIKFLQSLNIDTNSNNLKSEIQNLILKNPDLQTKEIETKVFDRRLAGEENLPISPVRKRAIALVKLENTDKYVVFKKNKQIENDFYFNSNYYFLPGGMVEQGEDWCDAAKRETLEEVGLQNLNFLQEIASLEVYLRYNNTISHNLEFYLEFEISQSDFENRQKAEIDENNCELLLVTLDELKKNNWEQLNWVIKKLKSTQKSDDDLTVILKKIYTEIIPELQKQGKSYEIDYDFTRKENKRYENLKKRGCKQIIKVS